MHLSLEASLQDSIVLENLFSPQAYCIDQVRISTVRTAYLQSLDTVINKPFRPSKSSTENRLQRNVCGNIMKLFWIATAWLTITPGIVQNALNAANLSRKPKFSIFISVCNF